MTITAKTSFVFLGILLCLALAGMFPSPNTFCIVSIIGTVLIIYQFYTVLTDDYVPSDEISGPLPGYRK
jgi:uncharacterized membrane protein